MARPQSDIQMTKCLRILNEEFDKFKDPRKGTPLIRLQDFLLTSYAIFALKYPSLLSFDIDMYEERKAHNLKTLFKVKDIPSDTHLRDIMDEVDNKFFRKIFTKLFAHIQRSKYIEAYEFIRVKDKPFYLMAADATGYFRSDKVMCDDCMIIETTKNNEPITKFGHNMLAGSIIHPDLKEVIALCPEPISNRDGSSKNDCEQNAFKRFIKDFRREHPKLDVVVALDALYATEPPITLMFENDLSFIIGVKETKNSLYMQVNDGEKSGLTKKHEYDFEIGDKIKKNVHHNYRYIKNVRLGQDMESPRVNFVEFWEKITWINRLGESKEKKRHFAFVTDLPVNKETIVNIVKGGRARWKIENETFNTLKNHGYHLEHNYGHGKKNLSLNLIMVMFIAFMIDQIQLMSCETFKKVMKKLKRRSYVIKDIIGKFNQLFFENWYQLYGLTIGTVKLEQRFINTS